VTLEQLLALQYHDSASAARLAGQRRPGDQPSRRRGPGLSFDQLRGYLPGDDVRSIDWRVTRRTGKPHSRVFHQESEQPLQLVVDQRAVLYFGSVSRLNSVVVAETAAAALFAALAARQPVAAELCGERGTVSFGRVRDRAAALPMVAALAKLNAELVQPPVAAVSGEGPVAVLERFASGQLHGRDIHLLGGQTLLEELPAALLAHLAKRNQLQLSIVIDPLEWSPPAGFNGQLLDAAGQLRQITLGRAAARQLGAANRARWQSWQQRCSALGVGLTAIGDRPPSALTGAVSA
jgi:uncharacterized protein (DUF58 family)